MAKQAGIGEMLKDIREDKIVSMQNPDCIKCNVPL
jgi:hypothetical protein